MSAGERASDAEARHAVESFLRALDDRIAGRAGSHSSESRTRLAAIRPTLAAKLRSAPEAWGRQIIDDLEADGDFDFGIGRNE